MPTKSPWTREERRVLEPLKTPWDIQCFLDAVPYSADPFYRCPRSVLRDRKAHCFDGAVFAAAALRRIGLRPTLLDLRAVRDDDHVIAVFQQGKHFGAVAKSNCTGLRFREPIHRTLRELVMTYFDPYFNVLGEKTLRSYSGLLDLGRLDALAWTTRDEALDELAARLDRARHYPLLTPAQVRKLNPIDERSKQAGFLGSDPAGLFQPTRLP